MMPMTWGGVAGDGKTLKFNNKNRILGARDSGWASTNGFCMYIDVRNIWLAS